MSNSNSVTLTVGSARIEVPARDVVSAILAKLTSDQSAVVESPNAAPAIGQFWPGQGGIYAGLMRGHDGNPDYHLIVPTDPRGFVREIAWGSQGKEEAGACSDFDGQANTTALAKSKHDHPAAEWADALDIEGHADFYLPSRRELRLCWVNVPELFDEGWYWSSTQHSALYAWNQGFGDGGQGISDKDTALRARAVRRFVSH